MRAPPTSSDSPMHEHPVVDILTVLGAAGVAVLTSEKTLIFLSICFTAYRWYLAWKKRNNPRKGDDE